MVTRTKLELEINQPIEVELLYDEPVTGKNQYGDYYLYAVKSNGSEFSYFPPESVHEQLKQLRRGDKVVITKLAAQRGKQLITTYSVDTAANPIKTESKTESVTDKPDKYYEIMLSSYKDALRINGELNGLADASKIAVTLFIARSRE
ncbi:MAG: hypothetical protein K8F60_18625 [Melioribacteraceae bacterium]|nr:hypothetical protein [Melioribacteraceae bacterium]